MRKQNGFTLIEVIVVIVLLGIMAAGAGLLISRPIDAYSDQVRRQQLVDSSEMALRKIATDIRRALPNSIRIDNHASGGWVLEMVNTVDGARYRDEVGGAGVSANETLQFASADNHFNILGRFDASTEALIAGGGIRVAIYNTSPEDIYNDAVSVNPGIISGAIRSLTPAAPAPGVEHHIELDALYRFEFRSPSQRLFLVDGAVSYICDLNNGVLVRYDGYGIPQNQILAGGGFPVGTNSGRVATQVDNCAIDYQAGTAQRGGLITLDLTLEDAQNERVRLLHQVHVDNVP